MRREVPPRPSATLSFGRARERRRWGEGGGMHNRVVPGTLGAGGERLFLRGPCVPPAALGAAGDDLF